MTRTRRQRRAFTLLEVMIATAILVVSLVVLTQTQATAVTASFEAERIQVATELAREKMSEVQILVEKEGFPQGGDLYDRGDFRNFGNEVLNIQFGKHLKEYNWEYLVQEIDLELAGDLMGTVNALTGAFGRGGGESMSNLDLPGGGLGAVSGMISPEMITNLLDPYLREVRVRVWWGKNSAEAEELGNEVIIVQHISTPGRMALVDPTQQQMPPGAQPGQPGMPGQPGGRGGQPMGPGGMQSGSRFGGGPMGGGGVAPGGAR